MLWWYFSSRTLTLTSSVSLPLYRVAVAATRARVLCTDHKGVVVWVQLLLACMMFQLSGACR